MTQPRKALVSVEDTLYYHVVSRCVRRSFLCGEDRSTGKSYEHRRQWIEDRIRILSSIFAIDICSYAVMSNHFHIVVKLNPKDSAQWSDEQVVERWTSLFKGPLLVQRWIAAEPMTEAEVKTVREIIAIYRERLANLSWFMKCLNEPIARQANREDGCTGHFWESRFKSQALLTEDALLSCMAYVDLNPIRAAMADTPENSDHTSLKERISPSFDLEAALQNQDKIEGLQHFDLPIKPLLKFEGAVRQTEQAGILFDMNEYLQLVDTTGRMVREDKRGAIPSHLPPILDRLNLSFEEWLDNAAQFELIYHQRFKHRRLAS